VLGRFLSLCECGISFYILGLEIINGIFAQIGWFYEKK
jgi:hypothetical protein